MRYKSYLSRPEYNALIFITLVFHGSPGGNNSIFTMYLSDYALISSDDTGFSL